MNSTTDKFDYKGKEATVIVPENPNGNWVWRAEFLGAFDYADQALLKKRLAYCVLSPVRYVWL